MNFEEEIEDAVICPVCNHEQELHVIPTVNVTLDPDMKEKVLSGEIFLFTCENCGFSGFAGFPFIYEDKETYGGFLIYMEPGCEEREVGVDGDIADQVLLQNGPVSSGSSFLSSFLVAIQLALCSDNLSLKGAHLLFGNIAALELLFLRSFCYERLNRFFVNARKQKCICKKTR